MKTVRLTGTGLDCPPSNKINIKWKEEKEEEDDEEEEKEEEEKEEED